MTTDTDHLGHTVRSLRVLRGLSLAEVAESAKISVNTVARIERGEPGLESKTQAVANALGVTLEELTLAMARARSGTA